jgi:hypothetical protein
VEILENINKKKKRMRNRKGKRRQKINRKNKAEGNVKEK